MLDGCWPANVHPGDIDGFIERRGISLFLEHKKPGAKLGRGQMIAYESLARQGNTTLACWGDRLNVEALQIIGPSGTRPIVEASLEEMRRLCAGWWRQASRR